MTPKPPEHAIPDVPPVGTAPPIATPTGRAPRVSMARANGTLALLSFAAFLFVTGEISPIGLISLIADDLGKNDGQIGLLVTAYAFIIAAASFPLARVTGAIPRRLILPGVLGAYAAGMIVAVTVPGYGGLLAGRLLTACAQALFWAVVTATAAGLYPLERRGTAVARLLIGPSAAGVLGLPAVTWLGQHVGWRVPFVVLACIAVLVAFAVAAVLPNYRPADGAAARGSHPSRARYLLVLATILLVIWGNNLAFTYVSPFFEDVSRFASDTIPTLFLVSGIAGLVAMLAVGRFLDRFPVGTMVVGTGLLTVAWGGVAAFGTSRAAALAFFCLVSAGLSIVVGSYANRVMQVSPGNTDYGIAIYASFYNVGIAAGSAVGSPLLEDAGARWLPIVATAFVAAGFVLVSLQKRVGRGR